MHGQGRLAYFEMPPEKPLSDSFPRKAIEGEKMTYAWTGRACLLLNATSKTTPRLFPKIS